MKTLFITLFTLSIFTATAQELKKVTKTESTSPFTNYKEEYEVLKEDKKTKHGLYKKWMNNILVEEGYYKNNKKDSTWTRYGSHANTLVVGNYDKDEKVGIWKFYTTTGELEQEYDYSKKEIVSFKPDPPNTNYQVLNGTDTTYEQLSRPPMVVGGAHSYLITIAKNLRYPVGAHKSNISGKVYVRFVIDEKGDTSNYGVLKAGDKSLDEEAIRVVKLIEGWQPAMIDDKPVKVIHTIPITFGGSSIIGR